MRAADMSPEGAAPKRESRPAGTGATLENGNDSSPDSTCEGRGSQGPTVIRKNALEEIRVELSEYNGHDLINLRVWADPRNGGAERIPTGAGVACRVALLPELISALRQAEVEARERGLI